MVRALVVYAHPCADSFVAAVAERATAALSHGGHHVEWLDLHQASFDPRLTADEHGAHRGPLATKPQIVPYAEQLRRCDTVVLIYPTWWGGQPAMLKGWLERVWVNEVAWALPADTGRGAPQPLLRNVRRIIAITTHGSSKWINALEGEGGKRIVKRAMRASCGWRCRTEWIAMYNVDRSSLRDREQFLEKVSRRIARLR